MPPTSLHCSTNRPAVEAQLPSSSTLYLDDKSTRLTSRHLMKAKHTGKAQKHSHPAKSSAPLSSPSRPAPLKTKSPRGPDISGHTRYALEGDDTSSDAGLRQQRSKVCIKLPTVPVVVRVDSGLDTVQPFENFLSTSIESITKLQTDSSTDGPSEGRHPSRGRSPLVSTYQFSAQPKIPHIRRPSARSKDNFYSVIVDKTADAMVRHIQAAWQTSLESKYLQDSEATKVASTCQSGLGISAFDPGTYNIITEQLFNQRGRRADRKCKKQSQQENKGITTAMAGADPYMNSVVLSVVDQAQRQGRSLSAPEDCRGPRRPCNNIHSSAHESEEEQHSSLTSPFSNRASPQRPFTALDKPLHILRNHIKFLQEPRKRAIRALAKSLLTIPNGIFPSTKPLSVPAQQLSSSTSQPYALLNGQRVPILYSTDDSPFVSKLRSNFSYTDLEFTFNTRVNRDNNLKRNTIEDTGTRQQVQKKASEPYPTLHPEKPPPNQVLDDRKLKELSKNFLIDTVCSVPLGASSTRNIFYSPVNFSNADESEEDCIHRYTLASNLSVKQKILDDTSVLEKRENVLKNDTLKGIAESLKNLESMQQTRKSSAVLPRVQSSSAVEILYSKGEDAMKAPLPDPSHSPRRKVVEHSGFERTLRLRDLATHPTESKPEQSHKRYTTINSVSSALPQTAKSSRFFTFNV